MPTVLIIFGLRFYFYSNDHEPMHIHVQSTDGVAKFEILDQIVLLSNEGLKNKDLKLAESIIEENLENFRENWQKFFNEGSV